MDLEAKAQNGTLQSSELHDRCLIIGWFNVLCKALIKVVAQSARAVEYTDCTSAKG